MTTILIVLALLVVAAVIVFMAVRKKPTTTTNAPGEADTAWNDPVTPGAPAARDRTTDQAPRV